MISTNHFDGDSLIGFWLDSIDFSNPDSKRNYVYSIRVYKAFLDDRSMEIMEAEPADIDAFFASLNTRFSPSTAQGISRHVKTFYRWCFEMGYTPSNQALGSKGPTLHPCRQRRALTVDEARSILTEASLKEGSAARRDEAIVALMLYAAMKPGELAAANFEDVVISGQTAVMRARNGSILYIPTNATVPLRNYLSLLPRREPADPLFVSLSHRSMYKRLSLRSIREIVQGAFEAADIKAKPQDCSLQATSFELLERDGFSNEQLMRHARIRNIRQLEWSLKQPTPSEPPAEAVQQIVERDELKASCCTISVDHLKAMVEKLGTASYAVLFFSEGKELEIKPLEE